MPVVRLFAALIVASLLSGCGTIAERRFTGDARSHIKHVVIIVQENRSFDNLFHGFPGADTAETGLIHDGSRVPLHPVSLRVKYDISNGGRDFIRSYDGAKMDGWDHRRITIARNDFFGPDPQYAYVPHEEVKPYFDLARQYVLADRMFQSNIDQSFVAHLYLIAGQAGHAVNVPNGRPWGCDAFRGTKVRTLKDDRTPGEAVFPCFDFTTLGDELDARQLTWRYYAPKVDSSAVWARFIRARRKHRIPPGMRTPEFGQLWTSYDAVAHDRYGPDWTTNVVSPERRILDDVAHGDLADVTWVIPDWLNSDHSSSRSATGPSWVASVVNAIGRSKFWSSTAILVTWDDSGGWYDHVPPPQLDYDGLGFRVPLIVVSPYAKRGHVTHVQYEFGSMLRFAETIFDLQPLAASDRRANDLSDCFDFTQAPRAFTPIPAPYAPDYFTAQRASNVPPDTD